MKKNNAMTIWMPLIGAFIMFVAVFIIYTNLDNNFYSEMGSRLFESGFVVLLGIVLSVVMFLFFRSSGIKKAKKAQEKNIENDYIDSYFKRKQRTAREKHTYKANIEHEKAKIAWLQGKY